MLAVAGACLLGVFSVTGCLNPFAPQIDDGSILTELVTDQSTPEEVLSNFQYAYTFRDSLLYSDVLDSAFVFQYFDPDQGSSGLFVSWTRETDLKTTGQLLRSFDVVALEWLNTIYSLSDTVVTPQGGREAQETLAKSFRLDLSNPDVAFTVSGFAIFTLRQDPHDSKWRIMRWVDQSDL